jgi:AMP deaminase
MDLEFVLGVISDGPTKSFAYRRLQYLTSKFDMYYLLNEFQEIADMKVRIRIPWLPSLTQKKTTECPA